MKSFFAVGVCSFYRQQTRIIPFPGFSLCVALPLFMIVDLELISEKISSKLKINQKPPVLVVTVQLAMTFQGMCIMIIIKFLFKLCEALASTNLQQKVSVVGDLVLAQILVSDEGVPSVGSACLERGDDGAVDSGGGGAGAGHSEPNLAARVGASSTILVIAVRRHAAPRASDEQRRNKQRYSHREK